MAFQSINPATEELLGEFPEDGPERIEAALAAADRAPVLREHLLHQIPDTARAAMATGIV